MNSTFLRYNRGFSQTYLLGSFVRNARMSPKIAFCLGNMRVKRALGSYVFRSNRRDFAKPPVIAGSRSFHQGTWGAPFGQTPAMRCPSATDGLSDFAIALTDVSRKTLDI